LAACHPRWQTAIRDEANARLPRPLVTVSTAIARELRTADVFLKESLRLFPAPFISRMSVQADECGKYKIPAKANLCIFSWAVQRDPIYFANPEQFQPTRFPSDLESIAVQPAAKAPLGAYIPFSIGSRMCVGQSFASAEMKIALAVLLREFSLLPDRKPPPTSPFALSRQLRTRDPSQPDFLEVAVDWEHAVLHSRDRILLQASPARS